MESELMKINAEEGRTDLEKASAALCLIRKIADQLSITTHTSDQLIKDDYHYYQKVQYRVMVYLLYFDWLVDYLEGRCDKLQQYMANALPNGTYDRWKKAGIEAEIMRRKYVDAMIQG